ncbi:transcription antitermination factor NusB [Psychroflexus sp. CAK57W]|uniref:transcription antitermination factor NusB n=1 Tax=Psychroflexus curvus TaxID=2873595 RepID=UPI001CCE2C9F|nr:transcription antitermination factor NusB [Psychroflexus curvus]MBZ9627860.1 transcription antitermination factor NusB [Psychroflexus curvus]MBZ9787537.1 transcription antitermination factor NusB [Psychroflexus curvus]
MLTRRHIRAKVMQSLYAFHQGSKDSMQAEEKFLKKSTEDMYNLFLLNLELLVNIRSQAEDYYKIVKKKFLATEEEKNPNKKFINNQLLHRIANSNALSELVESKKLNHWSRDDEYPILIWNKILESDIYSDYIFTETSSFKEDKEFVVDIFKKIIAPNDDLYDYYEDHNLTWIDDFPIVNTTLLKFLQKQKESDEVLNIPRLYKNVEDENFARELFTKTLLADEEFSEITRNKTPNWDQDRIAEIDSILIKMALCEFIKFPSIPVRVTINEYLELAKEYSTPKSSTFINGVLDTVSKEYQSNGKINKVGRGLM